MAYPKPKRLSELSPLSKNDFQTPLRTYVLIEIVYIVCALIVIIENLLNFNSN